MPPDRTGGRNVFIEFASQPGVIQGGLCAATSCTRREFLELLDILIDVQGGFDAVLYGTSTPISPTTQRLRRGRYILSPKTPGQAMQINNERYHPRTLSLSNTARSAEFRQQVRQRDGRCVVTGRINHDAAHGFWRGFEAAHIFPLALDGLFQSQGFSQLATPGPLDINSPRNGILLDSRVHQEWDGYSIAVNPNNGYRVQSFRPGAWDLHGQVLHPVCRLPGDARAVLDTLLRWHYEQAVLCNMRGAGEPMYDFDFPPGTDMMGEIREGPQPVERMEVELYGRLHGWYDSGINTDTGISGL
jgi:hypothetical protein